LQSASIKLKATTKALYGQGVLPVAEGRSQIAVTGDFELASYTGRLIRDFFGSSMATGQVLTVPNEAASVPATGPIPTRSQITPVSESTLASYTPQPAYRWWLLLHPPLLASIVTAAEKKGGISAGAAEMSGCWRQIT
jgi:hypothetical protein